MKESLTTLGVDFQFISAIDGKKLSKKQKQSYSRARSFMNYNRDLHWNEVACALSHASMWTKMVQESIKECLILEDDIQITEEMLSILSYRKQWLPDDWCVVNFAHDMAKPLPFKEVMNTDYQLCRFEGVVARTGAYLINLETAKKLIESVFPICYTADDFLGNQAVSGCRVYGVVPRCAHWNFGDGTSSIWTDISPNDFYRNSRRSSLGVLMRLIRRIVK